MVQIISFSVGNYLSFKDKMALSLEVAPIKELAGNRIVKDEAHLLLAAVVCGANASGKSNLIRALHVMWKTVVQSARLNSTDKLGLAPFHAEAATRGGPSHFEITFLHHRERVRYGFKADNDRIHAE